MKNHPKQIIKTICKIQNYSRNKSELEHKRFLKFILVLMMTTSSQRFGLDNLNYQ